MKTKKVLYSEVAYILGLVMLALGTAFMERAEFGMSMVVAPAYLLHLKISQYLPFYSFGMSEYVLQAALLIIMCLVLRRFRAGYLFSFVTAVIYGFTLDGCISLVSLLSCAGWTGRIVFYVVGMLLCSMGVSMLFHTYISPEVYELFVKELSARKGWEISRVKTVYDCCSCLVGVVLSFAFFGMWHFEGVKLGTVLCALVNGTLIGLFSRLYERCFTFRDAFRFRGIFENRGEENHA